MTKIMRGEVKQDKSLRATAVYRAILNYEKNSVAYGADYFHLNGIEMPTIDQRLTGLAYENAYFICGQDAIDTQLVRLNVKTGVKDKYDFGPLKFVTEPVFAPGKSGSSGYVLSEVYSHLDRKSFLAVFDAGNLAQGPIAEVWLKHHLPIGFHGSWLPK